MINAYKIGNIDQADKIKKQLAPLDPKKTNYKI